MRSLTYKGRIWLAYAFWCALAVSGFALTFGFEGDIANYRYGAGGWPRLLFAAMLLFATLQLVLDLRKGPEAEPTRTEDQGQGEGEATIGGLPVRVLVVPLLYIALLKPIGFFVATPPFLAGVMVSMGETRWPRILLATLAIYALVILVFIKLLYVPLPVGDWPGFYEIGNWALTMIR